MLRLDKILEKKKEDIIFPKRATINCEVFYIDVSFVKKRSSSVSIKDDKLVFRLSSSLRKNQAQEHFDSLFEKISKKIEKMGIKPKENDFSKIIEKSLFTFNAKQYRIEMTSNSKHTIKFKNDIFYIGNQTPLETIKKKIIKKLISSYEKKLEQYVRELNKSTYNFPINGFSLKAIDSKWGHCTGKNDIMLNLKLLNARREVLDYVIYHELAHIKVKNHSERFWKEVEKFCPNHKLLRKELRENPPKLFI